MRWTEPVRRGEDRDIPTATRATMAGEWPLSGMKAALRPAPAAYVTLNIMS